MGKLIANWFPEIRGRVMGFAAMGNNMGGLFLAPIAGLIIGFFFMEDRIFIYWYLRNNSLCFCCFSG